MLTALHALFSQQRFQPNQTVWVAYSGGLDSHVLLSLCHSLRDIFAFNLSAIHVNHHLHQAANQWVTHCEKVCSTYQIPFVIKNIHINLKKGDSLEALAREQRYQILMEVLNPGDVLLTAHHQTDQAETLLLQLCRGAGLQGLAAMPGQRPLGQAQHLRPLLHFPRETLHAYAVQQGLQWIEDTSNAELKFSRNFLRKEIVSLLKGRWPRVEAMLSRSAKHAAESQELLEEFSLMLLKDLKGSLPDTLSISKLKALSEPKQRLVLRTWIKNRGFSLPSTKKMSTLCENILTAGKDRIPHLVWGNAEIRRYRDDLYLNPVTVKHDSHLDSLWDISLPLMLSGIGHLAMRKVKGSGFAPQHAAFRVKFRQGGERLFIPGRGHCALKTLFQEWSIPVWQRNRIPLLFSEDQCIGVVGFYQHKDYVVNADEIGHEPYLL